VFLQFLEQQIMIYINRQYLNLKFLNEKNLYKFKWRKIKFIWEEKK
jgi:hypothetical protein